MKIIATVDNRKFIAELSLEEIDYLAGKKIGEDKGYYGNERTITSGTTFNITKAFDQIYRNGQRPAEPGIVIRCERRTARIYRRPSEPCRFRRECHRIGKYVAKRLLAKILYGLLYKINGLSLVFCH